MSSLMRPPSADPVMTSATLPPIMVAKVVSSRERGTWPCSRASCEAPLRRFFGSFAALFCFLGHQRTPSG